MNAWAAVIAVEGEVSTDRRLVAPGALTWETPLPLAGERTEGFAYDIVGTVEHIHRIVGEDGRNLLRATGVIWGPWPEGLAPCVSSVNGQFDTDMGEGGLLITRSAVIKGVYPGVPIWPDVRFD
jgi:hypothetical protein